MDKCLYRAEEANIATWCDEQEWRQLTRFTPRPDSVNQLAALYEEDRAGTMNLFPKQGVGYNTKVPGRHAGESYLEKMRFWDSGVNRLGLMRWHYNRNKMALWLLHFMSI